MTPTPLRSRLPQSIHGLLQAAFLILCMAYILAGTSLVPFHGDEATQIAMSRDYAYQFIARDFSRIAFDGEHVTAWEQDLRLLNGTINKYSVGLFWHVAGYSAADLNEQWDWGADFAYNTANNHMPTEGLLHVSRLPSALMLALGVLAIFAIGRWLGGAPVAYVAAAYYTLNPALLINGRRAMMEGSLILFSLLALLVGLWWLRSIAAGERRAQFTSAVLLGLSAGLALASKHSAIFSIAAVFAGCALYLVVWHRSRLIAGTAHLLCAGVIALIAFYALNPAWWGDPLGRVSDVLTRRSDLLAGQTAAFGGYPDVSAALDGYFRQSFIVPPQYFEVSGWDAWIGEAIATYGASIWAGVSIGGSALGGVIVMLLTLMGALSLIRDRSALRSTRWLVGVWSLVVLLSTLILTPLEWQRYYLLVYPAIGLLAAAGIRALVIAGRTRAL